MFSGAHKLALAVVILSFHAAGGAAAASPIAAFVGGSIPVAARPPVQAPKAAASIRGVVVSDEDRKPVPRARVTATSSALPDPRVTIAAPDGTFVFANLPAGAYTVSATATGFVPAELGKRRSMPSTPVQVTAGEAVTGIEIALQRAGVVAGQILDEDDRPLEGATVNALVSRTVEGRTAFVPVATAQTDDRGEFRLAGLAAGQVYVSAFDPAFTRVGDETGPLKYGPTYYPGVASADQATPVTIAPGAEAPRVVFKVRIVRAASVSGIIRTADGRPMLSAAVVMRPDQDDALAAVASQDVRLLPDGSFVFRNVPPGHYQIRVRGDIGGDHPSLFATFRVRVDGQDVNNVEMTLAPGARVEGRVLVEASKGTRPGQALAGVRVRAPLVDGTTFGDALTGDIRADGSYAIRGVAAGTHVITIEGLPEPWVLKSVTWRGQDVTDAGIAAESRQLYSDVRVTLTDIASDVSGTVRDRAGVPVADATVLFVPIAAQFWTRTSRRFRLLHSDAGGRYRVRGLPNGEYRAVASVQIDDGEAYRPGLLQEIVQSGVPVSVKDFSPQVVDLALTPAPRTPQATSR